MIVKRKGGLTEFIPSPQKKREGLIRDNVLELLENLHHRLERLEYDVGLPAEEAEVFTELFKSIKIDEMRKLELHTIQRAGSIKKIDSPPKKNCHKIFFNFFLTSKFILLYLLCPQSSVAFYI